jgi:uncharacterized protein YcfJ
MGLSAITLSSGAEAKGCTKGAILGGIAGHYVGHGVLEAISGCALGRHLANEQVARQAQQLVR